MAREMEFGLRFDRDLGEWELRLRLAGTGEWAAMRGALALLRRTGARVCKALGVDFAVIAEELETAEEVERWEQLEAQAIEREVRRSIRSGEALRG